MLFADCDFDRVTYNKDELSDNLNKFIDLSCINEFKFLKFMSSFPRTFVIYSNINDPDVILMLAIKTNKNKNKIDFFISSEKFFKYLNEKKDYVNCDYNNLPASVIYNYSNGYEIICRFKNKNGCNHNLNGPAYIYRKNNDELSCTYYINGDNIDENEYNNRLDVIIHQTKL